VSDRVRAEMGRLLSAGVAGFVFPGGAAAVSFRDAEGELRCVAAFAGTLARGEGPVREQTFYDLGAITTCVVATAALRMARSAALELDAPVEATLPDLRGGVLGAATLRDLLWHRGGIASWGGLYLDVPHELGSPAARRWVLFEAARRPSDGRRRREASDLAYLVAGEVLARAARVPLDQVVGREVLEPLRLESELSYPTALPSERRAAFVRGVAPTERCDWRGRLVRGEPQDENAAAMGGVAGHAGLFGTAAGVARFGRAVLDAYTGRGDFLEREAVLSALVDPSDATPLRMGWETRAGAVGRHLSTETFGKSAVTGASLWCDPTRDVVIALLTNRSCPSRANEKIEGFRPAFHDGVLAALG
jgi:CubicO group peptidase (beta-lactamase class C family)